MDFDTQTLSRSPSCIQTRAKPQVTASWIPACLKSLVLGVQAPGQVPSLSDQGWLDLVHLAYYVPVSGATQ